MNWERATSADREIIGRQIQRPPRNLHGLALRCACHCPKVTVNYPLGQGEADAAFFPTVFWLTCPEAVRRVSQIEDRGYISKIQDHIDHSAALSQELRDAHMEYIFVRRSLLAPETRLALRAEQAVWAPHVEQLGIGGVADLAGIKCLHMHYAHYLATHHNPVGRLVDHMLRLMQERWQCQCCQQMPEHAGVAELADATDLKSVEP